MAIGPHRADLEVKEYKSGKTLGRVQFLIHIRQLQQLEVALQDLQIKLNGKEDRPLFAIFRTRGNDERPCESDQTPT